MRYFVATWLVLVSISLPTLWAQEQKVPVTVALDPAAPKEPVTGDFYYDFRGAKPVPPIFQQFGVDAATVVRPEEGGLRVILPEGRRRTDKAGLRLPSRVEGDFEITTGFEILKGDRPTQGHGVGFSLWVTTFTPVKGETGAERLSRVNEGEVLLSFRMKTVDDKPQYNLQFHPTTARAGQIRLVRTGQTVTSWLGDASGAFQKLALDQSFDGPVQAIQVAAYPGYAPNAVDVLIKDLRIRKITAEEAVKIAAIPAQVAPVVHLPDDAPQGTPRSRIWLYLALGMGLLIGLVFGLALLFMLLRRRAGEAAPRPASRKL